MWRIHENCGKIILGFCLYFDEWECYFKCYCSVISQIQ